MTQDNSFRIAMLVVSIIFISVGCWRGSVPISNQMKTQKCCKLNRGECIVNYTRSDGPEIVNGTFKNPFIFSGFNEYRWCITFVPVPFVYLHMPETFLIIWFSSTITLGMIWTYIILLNTTGDDVCVNPDTRPLDLIRQDMGYEYFLVMAPTLVLFSIIIYNGVLEIKKMSKF